ncbi:hypothetical protein [Massilia putida]|uniref:hypothetical protein n=1 Tax=Massilia putida TaxID=1141883 RepID=UPI000952CC82|nr:hypothetical protein [Massilia putida]
MNAQSTSAGGKGQQNEQSSTIGVGNPTSGEEGSTLTHETMAETGGSGTQPRAEEIPPSPRQAGKEGNRQGPLDADAEGADTAATAINRGYQDTRSRQASPGSTGLGAPETGGNQTEDDLAPPRRD